MEYYGVYDYKESDTFRPTLEKRIHANYPVSKTITTRDDSCCVILSGGGQTIMRIRKLTPLECLKLMGFTQDDYQAMRDIGMTDSQIYHCAGDSIVVSVLMGIFGQMLPITETQLNEQITNYIEIVKGENKI